MATHTPQIVLWFLVLLCILPNLSSQSTTDAVGSGGTGQSYGYSNCTNDKMKVRKEWASIPTYERKEYIKAVHCLKNQPSGYNNTLVPGATSRYADFAAVHINKTQTVHGDAYFLAWHRFFVYLYEKALQEECGYEGTIPYWDWTLTTNNLSASALFDGSDTSLSGDGVVVPNLANITVLNITYPHGSGGGCIKSGPFVNFTTSFRAFDITEAFTGVPPKDPFEYVPNCLTRDLNNYLSSHFLTKSLVDSLIYNSSDIATFQDTVDSAPTETSLGVHSAGHFAAGRVLLDTFSSPGDPAFFLHHGMVDRVWTIWQELDPVNRQYAIAGTRTFQNIPPSDNATLDDVLSWGPLGPEMTLRDLMSNTDGPFCYRYE